MPNSGLQACKRGYPTSPEDVSCSLRAPRVLQSFTVASIPTQYRAIEELNQQLWGWGGPLGQYPVQRTCSSMSTAALGDMHLTLPLWFDGTSQRGPLPSHQCLSPKLEQSSGWVETFP